MKPKVHSNLVRWLFFWSGIIATFAYRIIVIVNHFSKTWSLILWYIGTIGFIIYFVQLLHQSRQLYERRIVVCNR
jgi:hypothetical protein